MSPSNVVLFTLLFGLSYLVTPVVVVWGWARWIAGKPKLWTIPSILSLTRFVLGSASAVFALWVIAFASEGGFESDYSYFYRFIRLGAVLSLSGILFGFMGSFGKSSLRWHAVVSAAGTLAFWAIATTWP